MSGITLILHPSWVKGDMADVFRSMIGHGTAVFVCQDLRMQPVPLEEWLKPSEPLPPPDDSASVRIIPKNTPRPRPYYQRGRW